MGVLGEGTKVRGIWAGGYRPRGMETGRGLRSFVVVTGEECAGPCGSREWVIGEGSGGIPSEWFAGVDCGEGRDSLGAG